MLEFALALVLVSPQEPANVPDVLNDASWTAWQHHIEPRPAELAWAEIPWRPTFAGGLRDAGAVRKPLLLFAMNGHPLGCT